MDRLGGKVGLCACMLLSATFSTLFACSHSMAMYVLSWALLRGSQPAGWVGIVKIAGAWVPVSRQGKIMAILSISFLVGDAIVRAVLGTLLNRSISWRAVFFFSAGMCAVLTLPALALLSNSPADKGFTSAGGGMSRADVVPHSKNSENNDQGTLQQKGGNPKKGHGNTSDKSMLSNRAFILVCLLSFVFTVIRETFNTYSVSYMQSMGFTPEQVPLKMK